MNRVTYKLFELLNNRCNFVNKEDNNYIDLLYQCCIYSQQKLNIELNIDKQEFLKTFHTMYDVLKFYMSQEEFHNICVYYLQLLMADALAGNKVDVYWCISHLWYLSAGKFLLSSDKYKDSIPFLQKRLIHEFDIQEKIGGKIKRKIITYDMISLKDE